MTARSECRPDAVAQMTVAERHHAVMMAIKDVRRDVFALACMIAALAAMIGGLLLILVSR